MVGIKTTGDSIPAGNMGFDTIRTGPMVWTRSYGEIRIPRTGYYQVTVSGLHPTHGGYKQAVIEVHVNQVLKLYVYNYRGNDANAVDWINGSSLISLKQNDNIRFINKYKNTVYCNTAQPCFIRIQFVG